MEPYVSWARNLGAEDTIVSFNYDRVCETTGARTIDVAAVRSGGVYQNPTCAMLYKLHGSVDWRVTDDGITIMENFHSDRTLGVQGENPIDLCIGTPGPSKRSAAQRLLPLWDAAMEAIRNALKSPSSTMVSPERR